MHRESRVIRIVYRRSDKILKMHGGIRPMSGHIANRVHQTARPAAIKMRAALLFKNGPKVISPIRLAVIVVQDGPAGKLWRSELFAKRHHRWGAREVVELEIRFAALDEMLDHGANGGDADTARDKNIAFRLRSRHRELVGRGFDGHFVALFGLGRETQ